MIALGSNTFAVFSHMWSSMGNVMLYRRIWNREEQKRQRVKQKCHQRHDVNWKVGNVEYFYDNRLFLYYFLEGRGGAFHEKINRRAMEGLRSQLVAPKRRMTQRYPAGERNNIWANLDRKWVHIVHPLLVKNPEVSAPTFFIAFFAHPLFSSSLFTLHTHTHTPTSSDNQQINQNIAKEICIQRLRKYYFMYYQFHWFPSIVWIYLHRYNYCIYLTM